ncbi:MAG: hypothetical protein JSW25_04740, partial [Thermoplasmata archaeon]
MRAGVSCAVAVVLVLASLPLVSILYPDGSLASGSPVINPDKQLVVDKTRWVTDYEVWREVFVSSTGKLYIKGGGTLVTDNLVLDGNSLLTVQGGTLEITPRAHRTSAMISGHCSWFEVVGRSVVRIHGPDGGYDISTSMGCTVGINVSSSRAIHITDSTIDIRAGDGASPPEPLTSSDLSGRAFSGGDVDLNLTSENDHEMVWLAGLDVHLEAGEGGKAPDAVAPPPDKEGRLKGLGGGFTRGGDVGGRVGSGGDVRIALHGTTVEVSNAGFNVTAGTGGDGGDGAAVNMNVLAGAGGGGYTGGDGASGLAEEHGAMPGGDVSGQAGRGGDIDLIIDSVDLDLRLARFDMRGGDGGNAGDGGDSIGLGGGGGGQGHH